MHPGYRRWEDWKPKEQVTAELPNPEPTEPSKPGSVGFDGEDMGNLPVMTPELRSSHDDEHERGVPWCEWKAAALNRLFQEQGVTGQPGRITASTVRHGEAIRRASILTGKVS